MDTAQRTQSRGRQAVRDLSGVPKYIIIVALVIFIVLIFRFNSGSSVPFSEVEQAVESRIDTSAMERADDQTFKRDYGLNASDYDGVMLYVSTFNLSAEEILLVEVKDDAQMQEVEEAVENRIDNRRNDFEGYLPEQVRLLDESTVTIRGNYIFMVISADADEYQEAFRKSL